MTKKDKQILDNKLDEELAFIWIKLNRYECPDDFIHYEKEIERQSKLSIREYEKNNIISSINDYIESKIPYKLILKTSNHDLSEKEFEDFWKGNYENDKEAKENSDKRILMAIAKKYDLYDFIDWELNSSVVIAKMEKLYDENKDLERLR